MLMLTDNAVKKFKEIVEKEGAPGSGIRIFVSGGCWSPSLAMDIANGAKKGDVTFEKDGLKVFLEQEANKLLSNAILDFNDEQGFLITGMPQTSCCS